MYSEKNRQWRWVEGIILDGYIVSYKSLLHDESSDTIVPQGQVSLGMVFPFHGSSVGAGFLNLNIDISGQIIIYCTGLSCAF